MFTAYRVTSPYGWRTLDGARQFHNGIDLVKGQPGEKSPLPAFVPGLVEWAKWGDAGTGYGGYGNVVAIKDKYGFTHVYGHLDSIAVREGTRVTQGQIIGRQGTTGKSTGVHLHYEVRRLGWGSHVDPGAYLQDYFRKEDEVKVQTCKVYLDGVLVGEGILWNGKSYLPVRALEGKKYAIERWDTPTRSAYLRSVK